MLETMFCDGSGCKIGCKYLTGLHLLWKNMPLWSKVRAVGFRKVSESRLYWNGIMAAATFWIVMLLKCIKRPVSDTVRASVLKQFPIVMYLNEGSPRSQLCLLLTTSQRNRHERGFLHTVNIAWKSENIVSMKNLDIAIIFFLKKEIHNSSSPTHRPCPQTNLINSISCFYCCYVTQCSLSCCNWCSFSANNIVWIVCKGSPGYSWPSPWKKKQKKNKKATWEKVRKESRLY